MKIADNVLKAIGNTSIIKLNNVIQLDLVKILVKLE
jgi:cysteine synthase